MHVFGLTGGVASGKSLVAARFASRGAAVIDADELARQAVAPGSTGLAQVVERFGPELLTRAGNLNRARLAAVVFADPRALAQLNAIVHPVVAQLLALRLQALESQGVELVCYEVPLLFENGLEDRFRPVVLVAASPELQLERAIARSGWSEEQARARIAAQWPLERKRPLADHVIDNDGPLEITLAQADAVLDRVREQLHEA